MHPIGCQEADSAALLLLEKVQATRGEHCSLLSSSRLDSVILFLNIVQVIK